MKSTLVTFFIIGCILLIIQGSFGYIKGKINLRRQSYVNQALIEQGYDNDKSVKIKKSIFNSVIMLIIGGLGIFIFIYRSNKPGRKNTVHNYKF